MSAERLINVGNAIFSDIDKNEYLNELYESILYNYSLLKFNLLGERTQRHINVLDALRFADLLSKSTDPEKKDSHKMWAQEIIVLLHELDPQNSDVIYYAGSVFSNTTNYQGKKQLNSEYSGSNLLERYFTHYQEDYLTIPAAPELRFLSAQKSISRSTISSSSIILSASPRSSSSQSRRFMISSRSATCESFVTRTSFPSFPASSLSSII